MTDVRCAGCLRHERHGPDGVEVLQSGGSRRPAMHPELHAWQVLREARTGQTGPVVAACPACGQPMVAADGHVEALASWTLRLPEGPVVVGETLRGPDGPIEPDALTARLEAAYVERFRLRPGLALFQSTLMLSVIVPILLFILALITLSVFLFAIGNPPRM